MKGILPVRKDRTFANTANVRVLCFIPTAMRTLYTKGLAVKDTWSKRCDKRIFFSSKADKNFPIVKLNVREGREGLTSKTMLSLQYIYENHFTEADWFLKADDDTYIIVENLKYILSKYDFNQPLYLGHHYQKFVEQGYMSGGAGYVLSKEAVKRVAKIGHHNATLCRAWGGAEDVALGKCLQNLGVKTVSSLDSNQRQTFHPFNLNSHLFGPLPEWYYNYSKYAIQTVSTFYICAQKNLM